MGNQAKMNTRASRGNLGVYNALVSNDNDAGVWMSYLFVNWDDKKQDNYIEVDPLADGVAQSDTDWCTYQFEDMSTDGRTAGKRSFAGIDPHGSFFFKIKCLPF